MGNWWEDDLPNILGINPIEAAIIVGLLYYIYGPVVLYDYAREAGKAVSTFVPIIRDVTTDIFNEFRENMEENKEIEMLRKQGLDMSNYQKRTTNIFERFQTEYEVSPNLSLI
jgi:Sec-independent protein translocase protein TatA